LTDPFDALEEEGRAARAERKAAAVVPEPKRRGGKRSKRAGYRAEKMVEGRLERFGFRRVPLSGALGGALSGDLRRDRRDEAARAVEIIEVKRRRGQFVQLRRWATQGGAQIALLDSGGGLDPLAIVPMVTLEWLLFEAGYTRETP
jgi:hypothetical protein